MLTRNRQLTSYGVALSAVAIALLLMLILEPWLAVSQAPFLLFFGAIMLSAWYGGLKPGLLATALSALVSHYFLMAPAYSLSLDFAGVGRLSLFILQGILFSRLCESLRVVKQQSQTHLESLKISEERFRLALGNPDMIAFGQDEKLRYQWIHNPLSYESSTGVIGKTDRDLFSPTEAEHLTQIKQKVLQTGVSTREEVCMTIKGKVQYYDLMIEPLFAANEHPQGIACTAVNISQRKQVEQQLQVATQQVTKILESITDAFFAVDSAWRFTYVNRKFEETSQYSREELLGKSLWEIFPEVADSEFYREYHRAMEQRIPVSIEAMSIPRLGRWFSARAYPSGDGLAVYYEETTEKKRAEQRLLAQYAVTRALTEATTLIDAVPLILQALCEAFGWQLGIVWSVERDPVLRYVNSWTSSKIDAQAFIESTQQMTFTPGEGLIGQILTTHQPIWVSSIAESDHFLRNSLALENGLRAVFGFPILWGNEILGVIECFSDSEALLLSAARTPAPDEDILQMMAAIGPQIGQFIERQRAQAALKESQLLFESFMSHSPISAYIKDECGRYIYVNAIVEQWFHRPLAEFIGKTDFDLFGPEIAQQLSANDAKVINNHQAIRVLETAIQDNEERYYMSLKFPLTDSANRRLLGGMTIDVSDRIRAEEALRLSEERFRLAARAVTGVIYDWDVQTGTVYRSEGLYELIGLHPQDFPTTREGWLERIHPDDRAAIDRRFPSLDEIQSDRYEHEYRVRHEDGHWIDLWDRGYLIHDRNGQLVRVVGSTSDITERKQAEAEKQQLLEQIRTERELLEAVLQQMPAGIIIAEAPSGKLILGNQQVEQIWRHSFKQADNINQYENYQGFFPDGRLYRPEEWPLARSVTRGEVVVDEEIKFQRGDGTQGTILVNSIPIRDSQGQIRVGVVTFNDISERQQAEEAIRESEARFRGVVESNMVGILFWEANGCLTDGNSVSAQLLGYSQEELRARQIQWRSITPEEYRPLDDAMLAEILSTGCCLPFEKEFIRKDGSRIPILLGGAVLPGYSDRGVAFMLDMTERKQAETAQRLLGEASAILVSSLDYQNTLADIASLLVPTLADLCFMDVMSAEGKMQRITWKHRSQPSSQSSLAIGVQDTKAQLVEYVTDEWMQSLGSRAEDLQFIRDNQIQSLITVPFLARSRTLGALTLCTTLESGRHYQQTDLVLAEELAHRTALAIDNSQLYHQAQEANRIKDEFLAVLSHELRSPLNPILGWTKLLLTRKFDEQGTKRALETIERNAKLQTQLIEDLLDVSRILRGKMVLNITPVDLKATIEAALETVKLAAQAKSIQIQTQLNPNVGLVSGDANRFQQVIWNLLSNAVKFTPAQGHVEIRLEKVGAYAQIQVIDTGKGINSDFLPYVFEYFRQADSTTTRQFGGLGLGLAIVRHLVELHGGLIFAESPGEGLGATFSVRFPLMASVQSPTLDKPQDLVDTELTGVQILVVDDEADARELVAFILEQYGAQVTVAASAQEALAVLDRSVPKILLSDIGMPETNGYQLMQQVRSRSPQAGGQVSAIALTAYAGEYDQKQALAAGFQLHLPKPVEAERLVKAIARLLKD